MKRVQVHIERLVLRGVGGATPAAVAAGLQAELQRVLGETEALAALAQGGHLARLRVASLALGAATTPADLGRQAARGIGAGLARQAARRPRG